MKNNDLFGMKEVFHAFFYKSFLYKPCRQLFGGFWHLKISCCQQLIFIS